MFVHHVWIVMNHTSFVMIRHWIGVGCYLYVCWPRLDRDEPYIVCDDSPLNWCWLSSLRLFTTFGSWWTIHCLWWFAIELVLVARLVLVLVLHRDPPPPPHTPPRRPLPRPLITTTAGPNYQPPNLTRNILLPMALAMAKVLILIIRRSLPPTQGPIILGCRADVHPSQWQSSNA
jgi:hypothetical protein